MTYVIAEPCVDVLDKACIEECPVDCIYEGGRMLYIHPDECVDCGACEPVCPVEAIFYEDDLPDKWRDYTQANVDFFDELGSPGGASKVGKTDNDPELIANLPPQDRRTEPAQLPVQGLRSGAGWRRRCPTARVTCPAVSARPRPRRVGDRVDAQPVGVGDEPGGGLPARARHGDRTVGGGRGVDRQVGRHAAPRSSWWTRPRSARRTSS